MSVDDQRFPDARRRATRDILMTAIASDPDRKPLRRGRATTVLAIVGGSLAIPAAAAAFYAFATVEDTSMVRCLTEASLDGDAIYLGGATAEGDPGRPAQINDAVGACGEMWAQGVLRAGLHDAQPPTPDADLPVPRLEACVLDDGDQAVVAVVPGGLDVCAELGLPRWER